MIADAIIVAGGRASRLGGIDKASVNVGDSTLLDLALSATAGCREVCVVGPPRMLPEGVISTQEEPPFSGPVAAVAAGAGALPGGSDAVLVLACDMPFASEAVAQLYVRLESCVQADGVWGVDEDGREQPLLALYRTRALERALAGVRPAGASMRELTAGLRMVDVTVLRAAQDADTWNDVNRLRKEWG
ncbi:molybdenum cofactor guanylyltransferase [Demequina globuliformis]|uniref:molybdenum cofactor guanylyltransferase n=1 Tax=Demequina globuliformis TaxID=676202 RepID=UPI0007845032|nr:NTP transferase domain-containing protein [Demequina globuliformis]